MLRGLQGLQNEKEDKNTRYYIDLDLRTRTVLDWDYDQRNKLAVQDLTKPYHHRIFITKGQYNKLKKNLELKNRTAKEI